MNQYTTRRPISQPAILPAAVSPGADKLSPAISPAGLAAGRVVWYNQSKNLESVEVMVEMKRKTLGFALLLFGNLFAVPDALFFYTGLLIGVIGLCLVISGMKSDA